MSDTEHLSTVLTEKLQEYEEDGEDQIVKEDGLKVCVWFFKLNVSVKIRYNESSRCKVCTQ